MEFSQILQISESNIEEKSREFLPEDLPKLIGLLEEKDDKLRYRAFLLLQYRSQSMPDVYPYWNVFAKKLDDDNSYQRSIGLMLIAENARWDKEARLEKIIERYLAHIHDEKPITARQCLQSLEKIVPHKPNLYGIIIERMTELDLSRVKETMRKLILIDILGVLLAIRRYEKSDIAEKYIANALSGGILDKKAKKQIETML